MTGNRQIQPKYLIISADFFAQLGNRFVGLFLLNLLVFKGADALSSLVIMCIIDQAPSIFLSPVAGVWIDRIGARKWLILVNICKCIIVAVFVFISARWAVLFVYLCFIVVSLFFRIGCLSIILFLVPKDKLIVFNALNERIAIAGEIFSPWLAGLILAKTGQTIALSFAGVLFFISMLSLLWIPKLVGMSQKVSSETQKKGPENLLSGFSTPFKLNHHLGICFYVLGFALLGGGILNLGLPMHFKTNFHGDIAKWGFIMSAFQAGSFLATILLRVLTRAVQHAILHLTFLVLASAMFILSSVTGYIQLALLMLVCGCGFTLLHIYWESLIQQNSPKKYAGKIMSLLTSFRGLCYLITISAGAFVINVWGLETLMVVGAIMIGSAYFLIKTRKWNKPLHTVICGEGADN